MKKKNLRKSFEFMSILLLSAAFTVGVSSCKLGGEDNFSATTEGSSPESVFSQTPSHRVAYTGISAASVDFTEAAERSVNGVVHIKSTSVRASASQPQMVDPFEYFFGFGGRGQQRQQQPVVGYGSGVIISDDGYILTNSHVVENATEIEVTLNDNRSFAAKLVGRDPSTDIALLKVDENGLPTIPFGDSDTLKVGEWVLAVGNPFNLTSTVTAGIVSAKGRGNVFSRKGGDMRVESFIQTDAAVNPGNSGGALVNIRGELVGINTAIYSETGNFAGYSFAVPISIAAKVAADLKQYGTVQRAILGITIADINSALAKEKKLTVTEGAYVNGFAERSSAKEAGVEEGDVITAVNGVKVKSVSELQEQVNRYRPGDKVLLKVSRGNNTKQITVELRNMQGSTSLVKDADTETLGAAFKELTKEKKQLFGISGGVEVTGITAGKFKEAGITKGFIILSINENSVASPDDIERIVGEVSQGAMNDRGLFIKGFYPNGRTRYFAIDMAE